MNHYSELMHESNQTPELQLRLPAVTKSVAFRAGAAKIIAGKLYAAEHNNFVRLNEVDLLGTEILLSNKSINRLEPSSSNTQYIVVTYRKDGSKIKCFKLYDLETGSMKELDKPDIEFYLGGLQSEFGWLHTETDYSLNKTLIMEKPSGEVVWQIKLPKGINRHTVTKEWAINLNEKNGLIQKFDLSSGELLDEFDFKAHEEHRLSKNPKWYQLKAAPHIYQNVLAFTMWGGDLSFFDLNTMQVIAEPIKKIHMPYLALNQKGILFVAQGADLLQIDMTTQSIIDQKTIEFFDGSTLSRDGKILIEALSTTHVWLMVWNDDWKEDGRMCAINPETGKEEWGEFFNGIPSGTKIVNNRMYFTTTGMNLANQSEPASFVIEGAGGYIPD